MVPAGAAIAAYINARHSLSYDQNLLAAITPSAITLLLRNYRGRLSLYYQFEYLATSKTSANRAFLKFEDKSYTYAQAYDNVLRYGNWLKTRRGVKKGEIVGLDFQNCDSFVFLILALWSLGAQPALINYNLSGKALIHCVKRASARLMLVDPVVIGNVGEDVRHELPETSFEAFTSELIAEAMTIEPVRQPDEVRSDLKMDDMAMLIYTSGTTGLPKAAIVSWAKLSIAGLFTTRWIGTKSSDVFYTVS